MERGINSLFAFGGPRGLKNDKKAQNLLRRIVDDGNYIHSCLDYDGHLQTIKKIVESEHLKTKIIVKCYLNYPELNSPRRDPLIAQIIKVRELFRNSDVDIVPQISSIFYVPKNGYEKFITYIHDELGINRLLVEIFPNGKVSAIDFLRRVRVGIFNVGLVNEMKLGLTSYDNKDTYGFDTFMAEYISSNNLEIAPMRILGKIHTKVDLERAFDRLSLCTNYANFFRGITQVSTDKQYDELNYYARYLLRQKQFQNRSLQVESFKPQGRIRAINPYGLEYSYTFYFFIKSIWHKFKFCFKSIKSKKFIALKKLTPQGLF